ncbi:MAG: hypothetical protein ACT6XY_02355 [Phreatobacter sp.]|jgi:hypothetical protein|uniref:hypothetical protein n=1 Tax=Phreatobacter sp. TaxID=1966341 RepID=UPI00403684E2
MLCFNAPRSSLASLAGTLTVIAVASVSSTQPATAAGCGGYVNVFVSGCAPWDNNPRRMPGAPGYQAPRPTTQPALVGRVQQPPIQQRPVVTPTGQNRLITDNGAGLIRSGNRNPGLLANDGTSLRPGGNILSDQGGGFRR